MTGKTLCTIQFQRNNCKTNASVFYLDSSKFHICMVELILTYLIGGNAMGNSSPHERIIKNLCKERLLPIGVFQCGSSRVYIDDNGYFFTVIEFQPSGLAKGTYLNIALHFLWNEQDHISYNFPFGSSRVKDFIEYHNDEQFTQAVNTYIDAALKHIYFYRKLCDIETAKTYVKKWSREYANHPRIKELDTVYMLENEVVLEKIRRTRAFWHNKPALKKMKCYTLYDAESSN